METIYLILNITFAILIIFILYSIFIFILYSFLGFITHIVQQESFSNLFDETLEKIGKQMDDLTKGLFSKYISIFLIIFFAISWLSSKIILFGIAILIYIFWILLFLFSFIIKKSNIKLSLIIKRFIVLTNFIIGIGLLWNKHKFILLIGENAIKGFYIESYVHDETGESISNYKTEHWIGETILDIFSFSYYPFIIIIIFLTWKYLQKNSK